MLYIKSQKNDREVETTVEYHGAYVRKEIYVDGKDEDNKDIELETYFVGINGVGAIAKYSTYERALNEKKYMEFQVPKDMDNVAFYEMPKE